MRDNKSRFCCFWFFFLATPMQPTDQRPQHTTSYIITCQHSTKHITPSTFFFPAQIQAHLIRSGMSLAQEYLANCFLHDAHVPPTGNEPWTCPVLRARLVVCSKRADRTSDHHRRHWERKPRERRRDRKKKERWAEKDSDLTKQCERHKKQRRTRRDEKGRKYMRRDRHEKRNKRERRIAREKLLETLPCVHSKRFRVYSQNASVHYQNARVLGDTGVLKAQTGAFSMYTREHFSMEEGTKRTHTATTPPQQHAQQHPQHFLHTTQHHKHSLFTFLLSSHITLPLVTCVSLSSQVALFSHVSVSFHLSLSSHVCLSLHLSILVFISLLGSLMYLAPLSLPQEKGEMQIWNHYF